MPGEVKQCLRMELEGAAPPISRPVRSSRPPVEARSFTAFTAFSPAEEPREPPKKKRPHAAAAALAIAAPIAAAIPVHLHPSLRAAIALLLLAAAVVVMRRGRTARPADAPRRPERAVRIDASKLTFEGRDVSTLVALDEPFGVTLLATPRRDRVIAMLSSSLGTYSLGAALGDADRVTFGPLLDRALTVTTDDAGLESIGPDGEPLVFEPSELSAIVDALAAQNPACFERFVLTDARGATLTLDGRHLSLGDRSVDLSAPLEWRSIVFQEAFGAAVTVYQGTWVRQGGTEVVLVSLLPALGPPPDPDLELASFDRAVLRDLRLMQAMPDQPPPAEQRVAIERLFMLPLRSALDRAPRASHRTTRAQA